MQEVRRTDRKGNSLGGGKEGGRKQKKGTSDMWLKKS